MLLELGITIVEVCWLKWLHEIESSLAEEGTLLVDTVEGEHALAC